MVHKSFVSHRLEMCVCMGLCVDMYLNVCVCVHLRVCETHRERCMCSVTALAVPLFQTTCQHIFITFSHTPRPSLSTCGGWSSVAPPIRLRRSQCRERRSYLSDPALYAWLQPVRRGKERRKRPGRKEGNLGLLSTAQESSVGSKIDDTLPAK